MVEKYSDVVWRTWNAGEVQDLQQLNMNMMRKGSGFLHFTEKLQQVPYYFLNSFHYWTDADVHSSAEACVFPTTALGSFQPAVKKSRVVGGQTPGLKPETCPGETVAQVPLHFYL